ncbi:unnamed protein product [Cunninghamella echinulata]
MQVDNIPVLGGWSTKTRAFDGVDNALAFVLQQLNEKNGNEYQLGEVLKIETQTVAGTNYRFEFIVDTLNGQQKQLCKAQVYERVWEDFIELTSVELTPL